MSEQQLAALLDNSQAVTVGRYVLHRQIARGGMATIHIARLMGDEGFSRIVAAKRLLPEFAEDSEFVAMFLDEARIASKVHHRNVVPVLDVVTAMDEVVLVQEYVHGAPLHWLLNKARATKSPISVEIAVAIASQVLAGLHAAHEMVDELGMPLNVVHRDVSPQNVMVASDGTARLLDFGVAKASMSAHVTREGTYKGKLAYSAPEQLLGAATRQSDIYSSGVLIWELLVGHRMHHSQSEAELVTTIMSGKLPTITEALAADHEWSSIDEHHWQQLAALEPIVTRALDVDLAHRWRTAAEMDDALCGVVQPASASVLAAWIKELGKEYLDKNDKVLAAEEASWRKTGMASLRRPVVPAETRHPGELTTAGERNVPTDGASGSHDVIAVVPLRRSPYAMIAVLSMLVIALGMGIAIIASGPTASLAAATSSSAAPAGPTEAARTLPAVRAWRSGSSTTGSTTDSTTDSITDSIEIEPVSIGGVESNSATPPANRKQFRQAPPAPRPVVRPRVSTTMTSVAPSKTTTFGPFKTPITPPKTTPIAPATKPADPRPAFTAPAAEPATSAATSCTPPYYFEGSKKIFKPACL